MEIYKAHQQWANRPDDERFQDLQSLYNATKKYADDARTKDVPFEDIRVEANQGEVQLVGKMGIPAKFTHWAFGQLAQHVGAPASYLRELPATLAAQNLNHGLLKRAQDKAANAMASLLFHNNGGLLLRAITTDKYSRIWNYEIAQRVMDLTELGFEPARPDVRIITRHKKDCSLNAEQFTGSAETLNGCTCPENLPLYASDHDMFVFLRNPNLTVSEKGSSGAVYKGLIARNSEVGAAAFELMSFLYREMCGNHIIWGASRVLDLKIRHVGSARDRVGNFLAQVRSYAEESTSDLEAKIARAKTVLIADTKEAVLDAVFGKRSGLTRKDAEGGYDAVVEDQDGPANTVWGFAQGVTRFSQSQPFGDKRTAIDRAAGRILESF